MTDPVRRDPTEFLRVLKKMATTTSWQKSMLFASKGRMVGYRLTLEHYNTVLFSQSIWGRALEITRVIRAMNEDNVQMNGASYYYICNGMANVEHGWNYDFSINQRLPKLQHWRVAIEALTACEHNGFDTTDTMYNSTAISCVIPGINKWREACAILRKMLDDDRKLHPNTVKFFHDCLIRNMRPKEATALLRLAAKQKLAGYVDGPIVSEADVFKKEESTRAAPLLQDEQEALDAENSAPAPFTSQLHATERNSVFRPRVHRQQWYKWHAIANKYRPSSVLKKRQLAPRDSPSGLPAFHRL